MADESRPAWSRGESIYQIAEVPRLPYLSREWAWGGATGDGVRVAVVDSGVEADHPALQGCIDEEGSVALSMGAGGEVIEQEGPHEDLYGHGTACAGIIHAIAPEATITSVRVLGEALTGQAQVFLRGLAWAVERRFDVINLSLSTSRRDWALPFHEICDQAYFSGSLVVTAANNVRVLSFPSLYASVVSVACNLATDPLEFHLNPEPPTEFLARGVNVNLAWSGGTSMRATGNSFATPHISGIAALILSKHENLRPFQVKSALWATASNVPESHRERLRQMSGISHEPLSSPRAMSAIHDLSWLRRGGES